MKENHFKQKLTVFIVFFPNNFHTGKIVLCTLRKQHEVRSTLLADKSLRQNDSNVIGCRSMWSYRAARERNEARTAVKAECRIFSKETEESGKHVLLALRNFTKNILPEYYELLLLLLFDQSWQRHRPWTVAMTITVTRVLDGRKMVDGAPLVSLIWFVICEVVAKW